MPSASPADLNTPPIAAESNRALRRELWWFAGVTGFVWLVGFITNRLLAPEYAPFDRFVFMLMRSADDPANAIGPGWLGGVARDVTALGSWVVLLAVTVTAVGHFVATRNRLTASIIAGSSIGAMTLGELLKVIVDRPRPDLAPHAVDVFTASFPSGHAMSAAAAYLTLGALAAAAQSARAARAVLIAAAITVTVLVGLSRIYLAVHWPTDVLAGWSAGALWAIACLALLRRLQRRSAAPSPANPK